MEIFSYLVPLFLYSKLVTKFNDLRYRGILSCKSSKDNS